MKICSFLALLSWFVLTMLVSGCGKRSLPQEQLDQARNAVETCLRAWQKGDKAESLQKLDPPIRCHDDDWSKGMRLTSWEVTGVNGTASDSLPRCLIALSLVDRNGKASTRHVAYQVEKKQGILVLRDPYF